MVGRRVLVGRVLAGRGAAAVVVGGRVTELRSCGGLGVFGTLGALAQHEHQRKRPSGANARGSCFYAEARMRGELIV